MKSHPAPISVMPVSSPAPETFAIPKVLRYELHRSSSFFLRMNLLKFSPQTTFIDFVKFSVVKGISTVAVQPSEVIRASDTHTPSHPESKSPLLLFPCSSTISPSTCVPSGLI